MRYVLLIYILMPPQGDLLMPARLPILVRPLEPRRPARPARDRALARLDRLAVPAVRRALPRAATARYVDPPSSLLSALLN